MYTAVLVSTLALAPSAPPDRQPFEVADVEIERGADTTRLIAYDGDGEVSAEIVVWLDGDGRTRLDTVFADGLYQSVIVDGDDATVESSDAQEVAARSQTIGDWFTSDPVMEAKAWRCGVSLIAAAGFCAGAVVPPNAIGCMGAAVGIACECLPLVWEETECY